MKTNKILLSLFVFTFVLALNAFAQKDMYKDWDTERWQKEMAALKAKKEALLAEKASLTSAIEDLKKTTPDQVDKCNNEILALVGATKADVDAFRRKVNELDSKIKGRVQTKADRQAELDELKKNKISALPEFFDKVHNEMQNALNNWIEEKPEKTYTVVKGDHLWKISGKKDIFSNSWAWPKLYETNKDVIGKNPNLIYPKQTYTIPELTDDEVAKYDKMRRVWKAMQAKKAKEEAAAGQTK